MIDAETIGAVDLGGTHVAAGRVDLASASVTSRCRVSLAPDGTRAELLEGIVQAAAAVAAPDVGRWAVAAPGPFDYERGICTIRGVEKLDALYGVDLRAELSAALGLAGGSSVWFLNDAEAFLLGEWWAGAARGHGRVVGITLGTGLGSAFLSGGRIVVSGDGVPPEGSLHLVPFRGGLVEDVISSRGLLARYGDSSCLDVSTIAERARMRDARARQAFDDVTSALAELLAPWLREFAATCLVVGGSIALAWDLIAPVLEPALATVTSLQTLVRAEHIDDAPLLGAALHVATWGGRAPPR